MGTRLLRALGVALAGAMLVTAYGPVSADATTSNAGAGTTEPSATGGSHLSQGNPDVLPVADGNEHTLTIGNLGVTATWNPAMFRWGIWLQPQQLAYDSLIHQNTDLSYSPGLATAWEYSSPTEFSLTLREGVTFTDGEPFDAQAVKTDLEYKLANPGSLTAQIIAIDSVEVVDDTHIVIHLEEPNPALPQIFSEAMGMVASPKAYADSDVLNERPVGAGPYILDSDETVAGDTYVFVKNPDYWNAEHVAFTRVIYKVIPDLNSAYAALQAGEVDMTIATPDTVDAAEAAGFNVLTYTPLVDGIMFGDRAGTLVPALADVRVRQAMTMAIDQEAIAETILPGTVHDNIFPPGNEGYSEDLAHAYDYDVEEAKRLMAEAGYADGFSLTMLTLPSTPFGETVAADWEKIGIDVTIDSLAPTDYVAALTTSKYPVATVSQGTANTYLFTVYALLEDSPLNPFHVRDDEIEALFARSLTEDGPDRERTYHELMARTSELAWFAPIVLKDFSWLYNDAVTGVVSTPNQVLPYIYTWEPAS